VADSNSKLHTRFIRIAAGGYNSCKRGLTAASGGCGKSTARQAAPCEEELSSKSAYGGGGRSDAPLWPGDPMALSIRLPVRPLGWAHQNENRSRSVLPDSGWAPRQHDPAARQGHARMMFRTSPIADTSRDKPA